MNSFIYVPEMRAMIGHAVVREYESSIFSFVRTIRTYEHRVTILLRRGQLMYNCSYVLLYQVLYWYFGHGRSLFRDLTRSRPHTGADVSIDPWGVHTFGKLCASYYIVPGSSYLVYQYTSTQHVAYIYRK